MPVTQTRFSRGSGAKRRRIPIKSLHPPSHHLSHKITTVPFSEVYFFNLHSHQRSSGLRISNLFSLSPRPVASSYYSQQRIICESSSNPRCKGRNPKDFTVADRLAWLLGRILFCIKMILDTLLVLALLFVVREVMRLMFLPSYFTA